MSRHSLTDQGMTFDVTLCEARKPACVVLFAVGSGGNPERHFPLLTSLAEQDCIVVAPHFERLASPKPSEEELLLRVRRLWQALDFASRPDLPFVGIGHSIGATVLLGLAGGQLWMGPGQKLDIKPDKRLMRLVLITPPTGFFQAPGALDHVHTPLQVWAGSSDMITPPAQAIFLEQALGNRVPVDLRVVNGAGHFSFMNTLPPQITDSLADRDAFLADFTAEIQRFIAGLPKQL